MTRSLTLADIYNALSAAPWPAAWPNPTLTDVVIDSRQATPGSLFVAFPGERTDGHAYVAHAFSRGAVAAMVQRPVEAEATVLDLRRPEAARPDRVALPVCLLVPDCMVALQDAAAAWRRRFDLRVVGITGSVGKTTTKEITAQVLSRRYRTLKSLGNLNNEIGVPLTVLRLRSEHQCLVQEMGMYQLGEIARFCEIAQPQVGVVTNVGPVHLERLGTIERIAQAKAELVEALPPDGVAVLNADDPLVAAMASKTRARVFTYGLTPEADLWADEIVSQGMEGIRFRFHYQGEVLHIKVPLLGRHSVHTALRAAAVGLIEGLSWEEIVAGLQETGAQLRLVVVPGVRGATLLDDTYNASPASTLAALNLLADLDVNGGRRIAVLGDMLELGTYEETGHRMVGARAADVVDYLVTVGQRARWIADEAVSAGLPAARVIVLGSAQDAIERLRLLIGPGDMVLIKGSRGVQMEQIVSALSLSPRAATEEVP
ncbi:MAG: UDP-N-acetylmuramoyl-tripeptide--D-alanyl-D-alanine ligase [Caldilineales bacterium]|nr:UDP-N-acetylmuramoyl-tripeptide--D-alanyl-D-alanine ligase [Caldilineales bacterium]MDW8316295.1 UDP-N-acetylmuramoyl-tripeptide--D-alanyl-D-alanine ligase [Anaerolineae bacterium]